MKTLGHAPRLLGGVEVDLCECVFHAVNGATDGITCTKHPRSIALYIKEARS